TCFVFQEEDGIRDFHVTGVQTCALPISMAPGVDIGISDRNRKTISQDLAQFLSDSFTLYLKTHNFHWNVTGPMFNSLHAMFMDQIGRASCRERVEVLEVGQRLIKVNKVI